MNVALQGCCAEPLGSYLKGLAVLRLVSEQSDDEARLRWDGACFQLESKLDDETVLDFFMNQYRPTPILAPWNGGSGFYKKDRKIGLEAISASNDERFADYRRAIEIASNIPEVAQAKGESKNDEDERRAAVLRACRNMLPDVSIDWLDAAIGLSADGKRAFAPILGTGGNEGRLDYTNNFMENIATLLVAPTKKTPVRALLANALFNRDATAFEPASAGQYDPGRAGGFNQGAGVETKDIPSNPWNLVLALEGSVAWAAGLYRRQGVSYRSFLCSPFTVRASPVGYSSAGSKDEQTARAEIWAPLWRRPVRYAELKVLLREGRASVEAKPAQTGLEFAQAAAMLGVDRGIDRFMRYDLLKRRGDSYIALPAGQFRVKHRRDADLIRELAPILDSADRVLTRPPAAYESLRRQVDQAMFNALLRGGNEALLDVAAAVGRLHRRVLITEKGVRFWRGLGQKWIERLSDYPEARIAAALASIYDSDAGAIRDNLDATDQKFSWIGSSLADRLVSVLKRRLLTADAENAKTNPVASSYEARVQDAGRFIDGDVDDSLIEDLLFAFLLVKWEQIPRQSRQPVEQFPVWPVYALLKHLFLPHKLAQPGGGQVQLRPDLTLLSLLTADRINEAANIVIRRLRFAQFSPVQADYTAGLVGTRLGAALLIPVPYGFALQNSVLKQQS